MVNLVRREKVWDIPTMKSTLDARRRAVLPPVFHPGDVVDLEPHGADTVIVRLLRPVPRPRLQLVRRAGAVRFAGGPKVTLEDVRRFLEDDPVLQK